MKGCISVINSGSSSVKFSLFDRVEEPELRLLIHGQVDGIGVAPHFKVKDSGGTVVVNQDFESSKPANHEAVIGYVIDWIRNYRMDLDLQLLGVGHRVVHGGKTYSKPVLVDEEVLARLDELIPLAPLHQPHNLGTIRAVAKLGPDISQVACFDTAFHATCSSVSQTYAIPRELTDEGVRRYGFHGLSYEYISREFRKVAPDEADGKVIVAHLGSGASMCGLLRGQSRASSMGFSALDGLVMGTRPGNLDPGVVLYLLDEKGLSKSEVVDLLYKKSGLLGVSGISNDMRLLQESDDPRASEAIEIFLDRINSHLGSLAASLRGVDSIIFTAGIGENSPFIREKICTSAEWLGVKIDNEANQDGVRKISSNESAISVWVIPTDEELMIATHTRDLLTGSRE